MDSHLLQEVENILTRRFQVPVKINSILELSERERRNCIVRLNLESRTPYIPPSVIFKQSRIQDNEDTEALGRLARDWASLEFLSYLNTATPHAPQFYGGCMTHRFILFEDLGEVHVSLVDALTTDNRDLAEKALHRFMRGIGQIHRNGYGRTYLYEEILAKLYPQHRSWQVEVTATMERELPQLKKLWETLAFSPCHNLLDEIKIIYHDRLAPGPFSTLVHGDICPDNVFDDPEQDTMFFIDFEWTFVRNALSDGTYLRMNMPTCWCAKAIPEDLIENCELIYRSELVKTIPAARDDDAYYTAYTNACGFWTLKGILLLNDVLEADEIWPSGPVPFNSFWHSEENWVRPRILSRLETFIEVTKRYDKLPYMTIMADQILQKLKEYWPKVKPLAVYPAFSF